MVKFEEKGGWERCRWRGNFADQGSKSQDWEKSWDVPETGLGDPKKERRERVEGERRGIKGES